jgi:hypothetical protein
VPICANLSDQGDGGGLGDAGNGLGQRHRLRLRTRDEQALNLLLQVSQRAFAERDVLQQQAQLHQLDRAQMDRAPRPSNP